VETGTQSVLHTKGQGGEISFLFHHHRQEAHIEDTGSIQDTEVNLDAGDAQGGAKWTQRRRGLRGVVDLEERSTLGGHWSDGHLTGVHLEGTGSVHGGYDCEKRTRRI
jgi:hypothetical protein